MQIFYISKTYLLLFTSSLAPGLESIFLSSSLMGYNRLLLKPLLYFNIGAKPTLLDFIRK